MRKSIKEDFIRDNRLREMKREVREIYDELFNELKDSEHDFKYFLDELNKLSQNVSTYVFKKRKENKDILDFDESEKEIQNINKGEENNIEARVEEEIFQENELANQETVNIYQDLIKKINNIKFDKQIDYAYNKINNSLDYKSVSAIAYKPLEAIGYIEKKKLISATAPEIQEYFRNKMTEELYLEIGRDFRSLIFAPKEKKEGIKEIDNIVYKQTEQKVIQNDPKSFLNKILKKNNELDHNNILKSNLKESITKVKIEDSFKEAIQSKLSFTEWLGLSTREKNHKIVESEEIQKKYENQELIIDRFIKNNPKISLTEKKNNDEKTEELPSSVTITLANLYIEQGKFELAIKAFELLSLKYPEKSIYFANEIEKLRKKL